ncbi:MAG: Rieske 2Fe-2S domain-containing protein [Ktedonobacteraceae bacterium]|nr:Rieske 2Fe-2S domain-containing protein [Ktedonobacteraceae bacterium]
MQVAGFGLMHMLQQRGIEPNAQSYTHLLSIADTFLAAPEYIAPEVVQGQAVDMRSDIYSLGCILFELLSGQPPFHGEKPLEVARQHVTQTIPSLRKVAPDVPIALSSVVHQALERDPGQRFQNVAELGEAFAQASRGATSYQMQQAGESTGEVSRRYVGQDTPQEGYTAGNWQLRPPVATGQFSAIKTPRPAAQASRISTGTPDSWQLLPPIVTGRMPALKPSPAASAPPTLPPVVPQELPPSPRPAPVVQQSPARPVMTPAPQANTSKVQADSGNSMPGTNADTSDLVKAYEWWSLSDQVQEAPSAPAPIPASENGRRLPLENEADWTAEPLPLETTGRRKKQKSVQGPKKIQRRKVFAFIAAGGVAAAGAAVFLNFGHIVGTPAAKPGDHKNAPAQAPQQQANGNTNSAAQMPNQQQNNPKPANTPAPSQNGQMNMQDAPAANNANSVGSTKQMGNSSAEFTNPADKKMALLIHLSSGSFAAYERACTHEGVNVNYDPATKMLICPAHGAIFDPAKNGSVVQGPAEQPLPAVHIKVNGDGTITAV